ncbi:FAD-dependent thymidylate synthase [Bacillus licheniformis]|nr:FAD-dependent thymidylate synthase [Bacillus licheniformis]MEC0777482.1 FAD-dependent thymidylate synthase [Bacillus licheniformis]MEC1851440.1 FAD-dependent thymidylate synthase [Bacillus licheniformis]
MNVQLIAHTLVSEKFAKMFALNETEDALTDVGELFREGVTDGQAIALTAIRTCYSANKPSEIVAKEGVKYFGSKASDGGGGTDADRLFRMIVRSGHTSTLEHLSFTFAIEGVSRALLAQLTRHRVGFSFSVQSQRYVRMGSDDKIGGFDYVVPESIDGKHGAQEIFHETTDVLQNHYDMLRRRGIPAEDARAVLPQAAATNLVMTTNLRSLLEFYSKRKPGKGAQKEIADLAEALRQEVVNVEPWTAQFFEEV